MNKLTIPMMIDAYQVRDGGVYLSQANDDKLKFFIRVVDPTPVAPLPVVDKQSFDGVIDRYTIGSKSIHEQTPSIVSSVPEQTPDPTPSVVDEQTPISLSLRRSSIRTRDEAKEIRNLIVESKGGKCSNPECNVTNFQLLDLHHMDKETKAFTLGISEIMFRGDEDIAFEADKCKLLCKNCHWLEHYKKERIII